MEPSRWICCCQSPPRWICCWPRRDAIRNGGTSSGIPQPRQGGNSRFVQGDKQEYVRETALQAPTSVQKETEVVQALDLRFPCSPRCRPWWGSCDSAVHGGGQGSRDPPAAPTPEQLDASKGGCNSTLKQVLDRTCGSMEREVHARAGLLVGLVTPWESFAGAVCTWRTAPHERHKLDQFVKACSLWERPNDQYWRGLWRIFCHGRESHARAGEECEESSPWGRRSSKNVWDELTAVPIPHPFVGRR